MFDRFWDKAYPKHKNLMLFKLFNDIAGIPPIFPDILPFFPPVFLVFPVFLIYLCGLCGWSVSIFSGFGSVLFLNFGFGSVRLRYFGFRVPKYHWKSSESSFCVWNLHRRGKIFTKNGVLQVSMKSYHIFAISFQSLLLFLFKTLLG